jgi:hypothetical protein
LSGRKIFREQEIADVQLIVKRACKTGTDQICELPMLQKDCHPLPTNLFSHAGVKNVNRAVLDFATDYFDAILIAPGFLVETAQEP